MWGVTVRCCPDVEIATLAAAWIGGSAQRLCQMWGVTVRCCPDVGLPAWMLLGYGVLPTGVLGATHVQLWGASSPSPPWCARVCEHPCTSTPGLPVGTPQATLPSPGAVAILSSGTRGFCLVFSHWKAREFLGKASRGCQAAPSCKSKRFIALAADVLKPFSLPQAPPFISYPPGLRLIHFLLAPIPNFPLLVPAKSLWIRAEQLPEQRIPPLAAEQLPDSPIAASQRAGFGKPIGKDAYEGREQQRFPLYPPLFGVQQWGAFSQREAGGWNPLFPRIASPKK